MILIKIYDKDYTSLTTLTEQDFSELSYSRKLGEIGDAEFTVRLDREKITDVNLQSYNRIEIIEDSIVKFYGIITQKNVSLDTARVRCLESIYIFKKRLVGNAYIINDTVENAITDLINSINTADDTQIGLGDVSEAVGSINMTFNYADVFEILKQITKATGNQFMLDSDGNLTVANSLGTDKSTEITFRYNINQIANSNILRFRVEDDGDSIITKSYGKSGVYTSTQNDATLENKYGILENFRDFRVVNTQTLLDDFTDAEIKDRVYSPDIELNPKVEDNFLVGDTVLVKIKNSIVDIDDSFQIQEKSVQYIGNQRRMTVRINDLPNDLSERLAEREARLNLLEKEV